LFWNRSRRFRCRCSSFRQHHGGEAICFGIEAGDSGAGALLSVSIEEGEIRLQKLALLNHVLLARAFPHDRLSVHRKERLDDVPVAHKLREQPLTGTRRVRRLVLIVGLLRYCRSGNEQRRGNPFSWHAMICENRKRCTAFRLASRSSQSVKVKHPSELPLEFKCRKAKAAFGVSLSLLPLAAPRQHA
jgi:hypothetical protein